LLLVLHAPVLPAYLRSAQRSLRLRRTLFRMLRSLLADG
jgi:hypothetical protein